MSGFSANIINLITDNLRDRYHSGFPILKELMQNADDAKAKRFVFGDHPGFSSATHPLLQSLGLFFYNDGAFKESDKRAIASFAENAKAAEERTIGKFGLGMKSVFHLCEAFFYVVKNGSEIYCDILNPWNTQNASDGNLHPDWDNVTETHWKYLEQAAHRIAGRDGKWFFLWLPLRKRSHLKNERGDTDSIIERFPGDDGGEGRDISFLRDESLTSSLAVILPLLSHLSSIEYRSFLSDDSNFVLRLESEGRLERKASKAVAQGKVVAENRFHLVFYGNKQEASEGSVFSSLKKHAKWPKTFSRDAQGYLNQTPDKSKPEGSVLINHNDHKTGRLSIQWALFLPLDDETHLFEARVTQSVQHYRFIIHGQFFVEAGRRSIYAFRHLQESVQGGIDGLDEADLRKRWNQELAQQVVLPMFLPTLNEYVQRCGRSDSEISALTEAIGHAVSSDGSQGSRNFLETFGSSICARHSWLRVVERRGSGWQLVSHNEAIRILPVPPPPKSEPDRPWIVLPHLGDLDRAALFVDSNAARISRLLDNWKEDDLLNALGSVIPEVFSHSGLLEYLGEFIECAANLYLRTEKFQKVLIKVVLEGFRRTPLYILRQNRYRVSRIIGFIEPRHRITLGPQEHTAGTAIPEKIFSLLWGCETNVLLVPKDLDAQENQSDAKPQRNDILSWLQLIHDQLQQGENLLQERYLEIARQLLEKLDEADRGSLLRTNRELTIISAIDAHSLKAVPVSFRLLENARVRNNLFGFAQGMTQRQRAGLSLQLSAVIPNEPILLIRVETFRMLFSNEALSSASDGEAILRSLGVVIKSLGEETARRALIQHVDTPGNDRIARRGLRYLLHGDESHFSEDEDPLWVARHQQSPAWEKLWRQMIGIEGQDAWNVLKRGLAENLPQAHWDLLGITEIEPLQVIEELRRIGPVSINSESFSNTECEEILSFVNDEQLWKNLPLHGFLVGEKGAIAGNTYLDVGLHLPLELHGGIRIVAKTDNTQLAEKQRKWIPSMDEVAIIAISLNAPDPGRYWRFIADTLCKISPEKVMGFRQLRETSWLPLCNGKFIRPSDVIHIPALKSSIQILAAKAQYCYASIADLDEEFQNHPAIHVLQSVCFASGKDGLTHFGLLMAESDYFVGEIDIRDEDQLRKILPALAQLQMLPAWHIVEEVRKEFDLLSCINHIMPEIQRFFPQDTLVQTLNALASAAEQRGQGAEAAHLLYLQLYSKDETSAKKRLSEIRLRTKTGDWIYAGELCHGAADVCESVLLYDEQAEILDSVIVDTGKYYETKIDSTISVNIDHALQRSPEIIEDYFLKWKGLLQQDELIGVFLCLLGHQYHKLAEHYLGNHSCEWIIAKIQWKSPYEIDAVGRHQWVHDRTPVQVQELMEVAFEIIDKDQVVVHSLTGNKITVPLSKAFDTIIAGAPTWDGTYRCYLPLRNISPDNFDAKRLSSLIKQTVRYILDKCYYQMNASLDVIWQELEKSDQLEIEVARSKILNHLPFYLRQLSAHHKNIQLRKTLDEYDSALERLEEFKLSPVSQPGKEKNLIDELDEHRSRLAELFANNTSAQQAVLEALRQKIKDFQYDSQSIPFELFQNADDAVVEMSYFNADKSGQPFIPEQAKKFVIDVETGVVRFIHWGRMINSRGPRSKDDEERGFHRDLEKMLVLSSSDKPIDERVTGKFGLGFKSVFLCCDRPCIISGKIRIEIVGAVLPQLWKDAQHSASRLEKFTENRKYRGTLIELRLDKEVGPEDLIDRFQQLAGLLCIFGKAVRRIEISCGERMRQFIWHPKILDNGMEVGRCTLSTIGNSSCENGIVFRLQEGTVFLLLGPMGFDHLPKFVPSIWVTAPTRESESLGFAVSAPFALDAGRSRLAGDSKSNIGLAQKMGRQLGDKLISLKAHLDNNWQNTRQTLMLKEDMTVSSLWATLWRTLSIAALNYEGTNAGEICRELSQKTITKLLSADIPNGLPYPHEQMNPLASLLYELSGPWRRREVIDHISQGVIQIRHCADEDIVKILKRLGHGQLIKKVDFPLFLSALSEGKCQEKDASRLELLAKMIWDDLSQYEQESAENNMANLRYRSKDRQWLESRKLLCGTIGDNEEALRVPFAPDSSLLSDAYDKNGQEFFKRCRPRYEAPTELLAEWISRANTDAKKKAALKYLVRGELGHKVCRQLREHGLAGTWLKNIREDHEYLYGWDESDKSELLRILVEDIFITMTVLPVSVTQLKPKETLNAIYEWWQCRKKQEISKYETRVFPHGSFPILKYDILKNEPESRKGWLTLFLLGSCYTIGRSKPEQHKSFLELCQAKGWIDKFVSTDRDGLNEWMNIIKNYLENEIQDLYYFQWMKQFVSIFLISYWLDEYVESFMAINRIKSSFNLQQITCPGSYSVFSGGGPDAPPINRALGMGACFVLRELVRKGMITNPQAHQYCYVPRKSVRDLLSRMGCDGLDDQNDHESRSKIIYQFLCQHLAKERVTFNNSFDLPLLIVASDSDLQQELFNKRVLEPSEIDETEDYDDE